jgi:hypothetical protein
VLSSVTIEGILPTLAVKAATAARIFVTCVEEVLRGGAQRRCSEEVLVLGFGAGQVVMDEPGAYGPRRANLAAMSGT